MKKFNLVPSKNFTKAQEPFIPVKEGFGYMGVLMETTDGDSVQCHICGELFSSLGSHINSKHKITAREYKEKFGLNYMTALLPTFKSEERSKISEFNYNLNNGNLTNEEIKKYAQLKASEYRKSNAYRKSKKRNGNTIEMLNRFGICPLQLEERFIKIVDELGRAPTYTEMIDRDWALLAALVKRYKGYTNTLVYFGLRSKAQRRHLKWTKKTIELAIKKFVRDKKRLPNSRDTKMGALPDYMTIIKYFSNHDGAGWWKAKRLAWEYLKKLDPLASNMYNPRTLLRERLL